MADLKEAIRITRQVVESMPHDHPNRAVCLNNLGTQLTRQYERTGQMTDLEEAIETTRQAVELTRHDHPNRAACLTNLGNELESRYGRTGEMIDLEEAIEAARQAVESIAHDHPDRAICLNNLGTKLENRYKRTGEMTNLEEAIGTIRQAVESTPHNNPGRAGYLSNLGNELQSRYERTGEMADLEEAIEAARQAVESTPHDHPNRAAWLTNLGNKLEIRYERTGEMTDFEEAIETARQAVESMPHDHPDRATCLINLGTMLGQRYQRTGEMADLEEAAETARQAVGSMPHDHPNRAGYLNNLGTMLGRRYQRTGEMADLEEATETTRQAVESMPHDHPNRAVCLNNLRIKLGWRYDQTGEMADLEEATETTKQAVESMPYDHPNRVGYLNNLGTMLCRRYQRTGEMADLEEAIETARQAVGSMPHDHLDRAACLINLGTELEDRYGRTGEMADLEEASSYLYNAWHCYTATPFHRVKAATRCFTLLTLQSKIDTAIQLGQAIIDFLPVVNTRLLIRNDQQFVMSTFSGVAADVCAFLLTSHRPTVALEYLEKGRAVIVGQLIDGRSDLSSLQQNHSDIAHRYKKLLNEVNTPVGQLKQDTGRTQAAIRRKKTVAELDTCIREIRGIVGYERFLLGQMAAEMQECAVGGTIVIVNITRFQSDAILVSQAAVKTLNLPRLLASDAKAWLGRKWTGRGVRRQERPKKNKKYLQYLAWLWDVCVKAILDEVCNTDSAADRLPRIWWIGTGLGSSMPFHAAGIHSSGSTENAFSRALSSYTPSIKALRYAQHRVRTMDSVQGSLLIATMPTTPAQAGQLDANNDLPGVAEEKEKISNIATEYIPIEPLDLPSVEQVVGKLPGCRIAHFACHGSTDIADPSNSGLILQKGEGREAEQDRLTVHRVSELNLAHAHIAYLSACSTAENKAARLSDEVIHVVSGFQVAGFPHVVGCLWPSVDRVCVEVASRFYQSLFQQRRTTGWEGREVAWALREAVLAVREAEMEMPLKWAQFVHFGA